MKKEVINCIYNHNTMFNKAKYCFRNVILNESLCHMGWTITFTE